MGRLLVEVLEGTITEETRKEIYALKVKPIPMPFNHLVGAVQGSLLDNEKTTIEIAKDIGYFAKKIYEKEKPYDHI